MKLIKELNFTSPFSFKNSIAKKAKILFQKGMRELELNNKISYNVILMTSSMKANFSIIVKGNYYLILHISGKKDNPIQIQPFKNSVILDHVRKF